HCSASGVSLWNGVNTPPGEGSRQKNRPASRRRAQKTVWSEPLPKGEQPLGDKDDRDVDHKRDESDPNATKGEALPLEIHAREWPDDDGCKDCAERIQTRASQGYRTSSRGCQDDNAHPHHIPSQCSAFQEEFSFEKGRVMQNNLRKVFNHRRYPRPNPSGSTVGKSLGYAFCACHEP